MAFEFLEFRLLDRIFLFLAPPLALAVPLLSAFANLSVPIADRAALSILGGVLVIGLSLGMVASVAHRRIELIKAGALTVAVLLLIDQVAGGHSLLGALSEGRAAKSLTLAGIAVAVFGAMWLLREQIAKIAFIGALMFFGANIVIAPPPLVSSARAQDDLPPIIYIITDEMIGLDGIDRSLPGGDAAYQAMRTVLETHGFRIYARAYSRHFLSQISLPAALNFDEDYAVPGDVSTYTTSSPITFPALAIFDQWINDGYDLTIFETGHISFCAATSLAKCNQFASFDPSLMSHIQGAADRQMQLKMASYLRADVLNRAFSESYLIYNLSALVVDALYDPNFSSELIATPGFFDIHTFPERLVEFQDSILDAGRGAVHFAHFLMPHNPAVLDAECMPVRGRPWKSPYYLTESNGLVGAGLDAERSKFYGWYFQQVECLAGELDSLLDAVFAEHADATVVIHGDHGSRISAGRYIENLSDRDMMDNYSTLYAIRSPSVTAGYDDRVASIQRLTKEFFSEEPGPENMSIAVDAEGGLSVEIMPPPQFGTN